MGRFSLSLFGGAVALLSALGTAASPLGNGKEFSAEQVQIAPDGSRTVVQRMYVGADQLRFEQLAGRKGVMIADVAAGKGYRLMPERKQYMELPLPPQMVMPGSAAQQDPCAALPGFRCTKQGEEELNGRPAEKWEISGEHPQQGRVSSVQWIDKERRFPVKHQMPNGASFESRLVGMDTIDGRRVEKWESTAREGDQAQTTHFWFDPELSLRLREEFPGGASRELVNIQVGPQPAQLFEVPADYQAIAAPQGSGAGRMPPGGGGDRYGRAGSPGQPPRGQGGYQH
ncbi:hypothetical protein JCM17961_06840 [Endothiovibrio diazotrophicus]